MSFLLNNPTHPFISFHLSSSGSLESIWAVMGLEHDLYNCSFTPTANYQLTLMLWEEAGLHRENRHRHSENMQASHRKTPASGLEDKTFFKLFIPLMQSFHSAGGSYIFHADGTDQEQHIFPGIDVKCAVVSFRVCTHWIVGFTAEELTFVCAQQPPQQSQSNAVIIILICYVNVYKQKYPN